MPLRPVQGAVELLPGVFAFDVPPEGRDPRYASRGLMYERGEDGTIRQLTADLIWKRKFPKAKKITRKSKQRHMLLA